ncbi:TerD family protein [Nocardia xishanensis]
MSSVISKGGNVALGGGRLHVTVAPAGIDLSVLCVRDHGKVGDDSEFVFYNQPVSPDGAVRLTDGAICIDLPSVGAVTDRLVVAASVDNGVFGGIPLAVRITEDGGLAHDLPITGLSSETTVILGEVYRRANGWKLRNVAQGYASGLAGLATDFGISVDDEPAPPHPMTPPPPPGVNFTKGAVTLTKNAPPVLLEKAPVIRLRVAWASGTDYEAYALVVLKTGEVVHVATFDAKDTPANPQYRDLVRHLGDRGRGHVRRGGGQTEEIIEVRFAPEIVAIVPVAYSAINNGTGSFFKYRVTLAIENGADQVAIPADQAKKSSWIFTCVPGIVYNRPEGVLIERLELYSKRFSEFRPAASLQPDGRVEVRMDKGPINQYKADRS